jgi:hypothetical protein
MKPVLFALVLSVAAMCPQLEAASVVPACVTASLLAYENTTACVLGGGEGGVLVFAGFGFSVDNPDDAPVLNASEIELTPAPNGDGGSFTFSTTGGPGFSVPAGDTIIYDISDYFVIDPGPIVGGASLHGDPPTGDVVVTESICADSKFVPNEYECETSGPNVTFSNPQSLSIGTIPPFSLDASITLNPPAFVDGGIETVFDLTGGATGSTLDALTSGTDAYVLPEPVTSLLCLGGLIAIGIFRRRLMT